MLNFLAACDDYAFLSTILFAKRILEFICIAVPIMLILMSAIEVGKVVLNPDPKTIKSVMTRTVHKVIASVAVFFVPVLVSLLMNMLGNVNFNATSCWTNANNETIAAYKAAREVEEQAEQEKRDAEKKAAEDERKIVEATREAARQENEKKAEEAAKNASKNSTGTASQKAARLIEVAQQEYNKHLPDSPNSITRAYGSIGGTYGYAWCAAFVWYCSNESGVYPSEVNKKTAAVSEYINYFKSGDMGNRYELSKAAGGSYVPKMGDYIFFSNSHSQGAPSHIGLVKGISGDKVLIIDGNCSNTVCDRSLYLNDGYIIGYGVWE